MSIQMMAHNIFREDDSLAHSIMHIDSIALSEIAEEEIAARIGNESHRASQIDEETFSQCLPAVTQVKPPCSRKILIVDDHLVNIEALQIILQCKLHLNVDRLCDTAISGYEAIERV